MKIIKSFSGRLFASSAGTRAGSLAGSLVGALAGALLVSGCGAAPSSLHGPAAAAVPAAVRALPESPLALELHVVTARGRLEARTARGDWKSLTAGTSLPSSSGVRELRAGRRGAVLSLGAGDAAGRLWLRAGTTVQLGQDERGVRLAVTSGRARLRRLAASLPLFVGAAAQPVEGDVLVEAGVAGAQQVTPTGARLDLAAWALELDRPESGQGVGRLEAERAASPEAAEPLALAKVVVDIRTAGDLAITSVEHIFHNPAELAREGTFRFPVPDGALLTGLAMEVGGKLVEGEIVEREKARQIYEKIVDDMRDPALLEWEQGNWFKLRVFPIEAKSDKRVIIRYVQPLVHGASGWETAFSLDKPEAPIGELTVRINGQVAAQERQVASGLDLSVPVGEAAVPQVMREARGDFLYTAVRVAAPASLAAARLPGAPAAPRRLAFVFDTSRSTLESKPLSLEVLRRALDELAPSDRFLVLASDVAVVPHAADYVTASPEHIAAALDFLAKIEPDGASDLGAALAAVAARAPSEVVYLGDGIATWGQRDPAALAVLADQIHAPIHAGLLGKGATAQPWSELAGRSGGRAALVRSAGDAQRFALAATHAAEAPRLRDARLEVAGLAPADVSLFPASATTLYAGDELVALVRTPAKAPAPTELILHGTPAGGAPPIHQRIALARPMTVSHVAQRWAAYQLDALDAAGVEREQIVAVSEEFGLMSRYTSLLVLENDEAYEQHRIARRKAEEQARLAAAAPQITGGDLESLGARDASLSPSEIQPGDPEIKVPAPRDARSVVVSFPFGETKLAVWDADAAAWMVRFLIDKDTPDGEYRVRVTITHADGRIEVLTLPYTVDTAAPAVQMKVLRTRSGYLFRATQVTGAGGARRKDADKVEVVLPDGTVLPLQLVRRGVFEAAWRTAPLSDARTLKVVVRDRALNQATREVMIGGGR